MLQNGEIIKVTENFKLENQVFLSVNGQVILKLIIKEAEFEGTNSDVSYLMPI
jgi:hypothetical protein